MASKLFGMELAEVASRQAQEVRRALEKKSDRHLAVHAARKAIRRLRGTLALGRDVFGAKFDAIDKSLDRLADGLSALRDAQVVVETASKLANDHQPYWKEISDQLGHRRDRLLDAALSRDPDFSKRRARISRMALAITDLPWTDLTKKVVRDSVLHSLRRLEKAKTAAREEGSSVRLHRWRKRVRRLRLQLETLNGVAASADWKDLEAVKRKVESTRSLRRLADKLGWRQDLQVLRSSIRHAGNPALAKQLRSGIDHEIGRLKS
ncbi:CHAD domain-containing protein [Rhodanobacter ginsengiterrae]|uniref:CHAD domain-containing protein n=1 Tax=Rhodanobacter ginsengiterrae TaxID=2008451 RepID=UPI003CF01456